MSTIPSEKNYLSLHSTDNETLSRIMFCLNLVIKIKEFPDSEYIHQTKLDNMFFKSPNTRTNTTV